MAGKRDARVAYYRGLKEAMIDHMAITESGLRSLPGMSDDEREKVIGSVRKCHDKLLRKIDQRFADDVASAA